MEKYDFSWRIIEEHLPELTKGLIITLQISVAGMAFARVIVLNIRKPNGVSCPGWSSESQ